jgi:hypothetical protein
MCGQQQIIVDGHGSKRNAKRHIEKPQDTCQWLMRPKNGKGFLAINGTVYYISEREFTYENGWAGRLWLLRKPDGKTYQLTLDRDDNLTCDCPDATYRHDGTSCKHIRSVRAAYEWLEGRVELESALQRADGEEAPF